MLVFVLRTVILYLLLIAVIRCMGKRQIGQLEPSEFVVTMLVANLATIPMENMEDPIHTGVIPIVTVLALELLLALLSLKSIGLRRLLCGKPVILIDNGKLLPENLRSTRITLDELSGHLREKDVLDITTVQYAILETNGNLSVFPYPKHCPASAKEAGIHPKEQLLPVTIIGDGCLYKDNLPAAGKDRLWLNDFLQQHNVTVSDVWLLTVDKRGKTVLLTKEDLS